VLDPAAGSAARRRVLVAHPSAELYGSDRVMLESLEGFVAAGWRVLVALPGPGPLVAEVSSRGGLVVYCPSPVLRKSALRPAGFLRLLADAARGFGSGLRLLRRARPEVMYVSTLTIPLWLLLARLTGCRTVCHVHEAEGSASVRLRRLLAAPLFAADTIVANSEFSRQVLGSAFQSLGARTSVVYNGVPGPPTVPATRESIVEPVRLVYVGRLSERKGVDVAVSAVAELIRRGTAAELDIVGSVFPGYEWYEAELVDQVNRLGLRDRVRLRGFENPVWPRLVAADIALVPSRWDEPFGNTAVEAVLAGRPLIASDSSGLREAVADFESVIRVPPGDAGAIAQAVQSMLGRWPDYSRRARSDAVAAARRFGPPRYRTRITSILRQTSDG
jgi:glycosyltransferase involved in cell wall biosynthesis